MPNLELIKKIREATGCGIADCNKALAATDDSFDEAVDWLRKKGLSSAAKKSDRIATEGLVGLLIKGNRGAIIELNSETDFVARNDKFQDLVRNILEVAVTNRKSNNFIDELKSQKIGPKTVLDMVVDSIATIGENLQLRRANIVELSGEGAIASYVHTAIANGLGKIGVLVALKSKASKESLEEFGKKIAMHIAAAKPEFLNRESVTPEKLKKERDVLVEQARNSGKPENIIEKMVDGRIKKFYEEICLLDQIFIMDDKMHISDLLSEFKKETGESVEIQDYCLYVLGDGLEKKESDFAWEVASMIK
jgi:elongation factor Ts